MASSSTASAASQSIPVESDSKPGRQGRAGRVRREQQPTSGSMRGGAAGPNGLWREATLLACAVRRCPSHAVLPGRHLQGGSRRRHARIPWHGIHQERG